MVPVSRKKSTKKQTLHFIPLVLSYRLVLPNLDMLKKYFFKLNIEEVCKYESVSFLPSLFCTSGTMTTKKILADVDCGTDDAQAIMLALAAPNVEVLGVTCVHGNTTVENVCKNALRVLQACNKLEVGVETLCLELVCR